MSFGTLKLRGHPQDLPWRFKQDL